MLEELRIQCPSCGIVLDVRNSRHEAVKQIVCPNCKKQLAVDFQEKPLLSNDYIEVRAVRIADGSIKRILRVKRDGVMLNGQPLQIGDEVVLTETDELKMPETTPAPAIEEPKDDSPKRNWTWLYALAAGVVLAIAIVVLRPQRHSEPTVVQKPDTEQKDTTQSETESSKKHGSSKSKDKSKETKNVEVDYSKMTDYELGVLAAKADANAQFELGKRKVSKNDSVSVVLGINYLRLAAQSGSSSAKEKLGKVFQALQREAASGNTTAANILNEQR